MSKIRQQKLLFVGAILLPIMGLFALLRIYPIIQTFILSFHHYNILSPDKPFVGIDNYARLLFRDTDFQLSLRNTLLFVAITVPANVILALSIAMILESQKRRSPFFETLFFIPYMTPIVPIALVWQWMYSPNGFINTILEVFRMNPVGWLSMRLALFSIMIMFVWQMNGYLVIVFLVGLRNIPTMYRDAARIDGANRWREFIYITLPLLRPITLYAIVMATLWAFLIFSQAYVMTQGSDVAPGGAVKILTMDIYTKAFRYFRMGLASAEAVLLFLVVLVITLVQLRLGREK